MTSGEELSVKLMIAGRRVEVSQVVGSKRYRKKSGATGSPVGPQLLVGGCFLAYPSLQLEAPPSHRAPGAMYNRPTDRQTYDEAFRPRAPVAI
jgi:hypothetical protein